jgi:hypothetical protein
VTKPVAFLEWSRFRYEHAAQASELDFDANRGFDPLACTAGS